MKLEIDEQGVLNRVYLEPKETKVIIPDTVKEIGAYAFSNCSTLMEVEIPESVKQIGMGAFYSCCGLKSVYIPDTVTSISNSAFYKCNNLVEVRLPSTLKKIEEQTFHNCFNLKKINIPDTIETIGNGAFAYCESLEDFEFKEGLNKIGDQAFKNSSIEKIEFPESLTWIGNEAFCDCINLKEVDIKDNTAVINDSAFRDCLSLKEVRLPSTLTTIYCSVFEGCSSLKKIKLPKSLKRIYRCAFLDCESLETVDIPDDTDYIELEAFGGCLNLKEVSIGKNVRIVQGSAFGDGESLEKIHLKNISLLLQVSIERLIYELPNCYINDETLEIILLKEDKNLADIGFRKIEYTEDYKLKAQHRITVSNFIIMSLMLDKEKYDLIPTYLQHIFMKGTSFVNSNNFSEIKNAVNNVDKRFARLIRSMTKQGIMYHISTNIESYVDLYKFAISIGAFSQEDIVRQKACEFLVNAFAKSDFSIYSFHGSFESLKLNGYNKEWAEFIMDKKNFSKLVAIELDHNGYMARIYNYFSEIKEFGRSNKGSQRYLKVTLDMCNEFFAGVNFNGVNGDNKDIAKVLSPYTHSQRTFDDAVAIRKEYLLLREREKVDSHILKEELTSEIDDKRNRILDGIKGVVEDLDEIVEEKFSYEYLSKHDALNFVLGKYCSCCAHLEGVGYGITKASILHPNCQNLIIKNDKGEIIAKSTLYINKEAGYGIFNNVEVNNIIEEEDKEEIFKIYMKAVNAFAQRYNKKNPNNPLKQINVGMGLNDVKNQIFKYCNSSDEILEGINFSEYGGHKGDWQNEQRVLWVNKEYKGTRK